MKTNRVSVHGCLAAGGNANNGSNAGLSYLNSSNTPSNTYANYGSRLYSHYVLACPRVWAGGRGLNPYPSVKNNCDSVVLVGRQRREGSIPR